jgi:hypothetical protein
MKLGFEESQSSYASGSQNARAWTTGGAPGHRGGWKKR